MIRRASNGLILQKAQDYTPSLADADYIKKSDVPWLDRFANSGGHAVITGDVKMRHKDHEKLCLYEHGFVTIFFEAQWNGWKFFRKMALLLHWWEEIAEKIKTADRGTFWVVPSNWPIKGGNLRNESFGLAELLRDNPNRIVRRSRPQQRASPPSRRSSYDKRQIGLLDDLEASHDEPG